MILIKIRHKYEIFSPVNNKSIEKAPSNESKKKEIIKRYNWFQIINLYLITWLLIKTKKLDILTKKERKEPM